MIPDNQGIAETLGNMMLNHQIKVIVTDHPPQDAKALIDLEGLSKFADANVADYHQLNHKIFDRVSIMAPSLSNQGLLVMVQDTSGAFGLDQSTGSRGWGAGIAALAKTAALEWPEAIVKSIDIYTQNRSKEEIAKAILQELLYGGMEKQIGLKANGERLKVVTQEMKEIHLKEFSLAPHDIIIVSGGARGVTASCLLALAKKMPLKFAILGRTTLEDEPTETRDAKTEAELKQVLFKSAQARNEKILPKDLQKATQKILANREIQLVLKQIKALGSEVDYYSIDVREEQAVAQIISKIKTKWGAVSAIIHAAGVLADKYIKDKTKEQFQLVFDTKVKGLHHLLNSTKEESLKLLCCFSSIASFWGNVGQCDYAMANEVLNQICEEEQRKRGSQCLVKSLLWGPWAGGMAGPELQSHFARMGVKLIPLDEGADLFVEELHWQEKHRVSVVVGGPVGQWMQGLESMQKKEKSGEMTFFVHHSTYPILSSHRIQNNVIVPVALVIDWCCKAAELLLRGYCAYSCQHLKVLKGIKSSNFYSTGDVLHLHYQEIPADKGKCLQFSLIDNEGRSCYACNIIALQEDGIPPSQRKGIDIPLTPSSLPDGNIYHHRALFHGPDLQVIEEVQGITTNGCLVKLKNMSDLRVALLDGGLQVPVLWLWEQKKQYSLPLSISEVNFYKAFSNQQVLQCSVQIKSMTPTKVISDVEFVDMVGDVVCRFIDLQIFTTQQSTLNTQPEPKVMV